MQHRELETPFLNEEAFASETRPVERRPPLDGRERDAEPIEAEWRPAAAAAPLHESPLAWGIEPEVPLASNAEGGAEGEVRHPGQLRLRYDHPAALRLPRRPPRQGEVDPSLDTHEAAPEDGEVSTLPGHSRILISAEAEEPTGDDEAGVSGDLP